MIKTIKDKILWYNFVIQQKLTKLRSQNKWKEYFSLKKDLILMDYTLHEKGQKFNRMTPCQRKARRDEKKIYDKVIEMNLADGEFDIVFSEELLIHHKEQEPDWHEMLV